MPPAITTTPKAADILGASRALFLAHGVRRVSVEEICREAGVSKRTFYRYFRNRDALAARVIDELYDENGARIEAILAADTPLPEKARRIVAVKAALAAATSAEVFHEILTDDTEVGRVARDRQHAWDERVRGFYAAAQARGEIRPDIDVDLLMYVLTRLRELVEDPQLQSIETDFSRLVESVSTLFFYGILPRDGNHDGPAYDRSAT